jgi:choline dehydrogenase-like flavoprotein
MPGFEDRYYSVRRPAECIIPNFRNTKAKDADFVGGYVIFTGASRESLNAEGVDPAVGPGFKQAISRPGRWTAYMYMQGETIPKASNLVRLSREQTDQWGIPLLSVSVGYDDNDDRMVADFMTEGRRMLEAAGVRNVQAYDNHQAPGLDIHEMGGARMGNDPASSIVNSRSQVHSCRNVFVTDGACMASTGNQSPSILYMALTARAADFAVAEVKAGRF